jgi:AcrR family transcriptional regulator
MWHRPPTFPPRNVYYYFKTKDDLVDAAIDAHVREIEAMLASLERHRTPRARLKALIRACIEQRDLAAWRIGFLVGAAVCAAACLQSGRRGVDIPSVRGAASVCPRMVSRRRERGLDVTPPSRRSHGGPDGV